MELLNRTIQLLNKPFPQEETKLGSLKVIIAVSVFVFLFLYIFKPFDVGTFEEGQLFICLGFGATTFVASVLYEYILVPLLRIKGGKKTFTFWRWIIYLIGVMLCISVVNYVFVRLVIIGDFTWQFLPYMIRGTFAIGIFPTLVMGAAALMQQEKKYKNIAEEINQKESIKEVSSDEEKVSAFDIPVSQIRYIEALQNYVKIGYVDGEGGCQTQTERTTLKQVLEMLEGSTIAISHRSFLVNKSSIISTSGNAQGLLLSLSDCDKLIPVSRSYVSNFRTS